VSEWVSECVRACVRAWVSEWVSEWGREGGRGGGGGWGREDGGRESGRAWVSFFFNHYYNNCNYDQMMMLSTLYLITCIVGWIFILLVHWNNSPHAYMSLHSAYYPDSKPTNRCSSSERKRNKYQLYNPWFAPYVDLLHSRQAYQTLPHRCNSQVHVIDFGLWFYFISPDFAR
jgi:hypothetical protein